uniref:Transmembrane protein n=1 Tax=Trichobilharzia regenti TaxID=157069 RepID=A0AA85JFI2_TRIRE|nr:unnamed protein product [Trichobilharzia regenti]
MQSEEMKSSFKEYKKDICVFFIHVKNTVSFIAVCYWFFYVDFIGHHLLAAKDKSVTKTNSSKVKNYCFL